MMAGLDFLAVVSRPDFPSGAGPVGDYYGLRRLFDRHPNWRAEIVELNSRSTDVEWDAGRLRIKQSEAASFVVEDVKVALYLPICLETSETQLCPAAPGQQWPRFADEQWRPITAYFENRLTQGRCLNRPDRVRAANNKLLQFDSLRDAGFALPATTVRTGWPTGARLGERNALVAKNVSEGGWKSADEFSPARLVGPDDRYDPWPVIWQEALISDRELRAYVMGDEVTVVELTRHPDVIDVRATNGGRPSAHIVDAVPAEWRSTFFAMARALGLDYAVIDAIPTGTELHVLEVNANGVWWFLPADVGNRLEARFHAWLECEIEAARG